MYQRNKIFVPECKKRFAFLMTRHGESIWNQDSRFTGWTDIPLTERGREESRRIAHSLIYHRVFPTIMYTSTLQRAIDTSNIIKKEMNREIPVYTSWRLNERHYGKLEGVPRQHVRVNYGEKYTKMLRCNFHIKPPTDIDYVSLNENEYPIFRNCYYKRIKNGESKEDVLARMLPYYENDILYSMTKDNNIPLIVTHKHTARALMKHLLKISDHDFEKYEIPSKKLFYIVLDEFMEYKEHEEFSY